MRAFMEKIPDHRAENHPVEFAVILHTELVSIHSFIDGNGRAARLLMDLALFQAGYPVAIIPPILRRYYLDTLDETHRGNDGPFLRFISGICYESAKDNLRLLKS